MTMDAQTRWCRLRILAAASAVLAAVPADAQPGDDGLREDSLGVAADAVPLPRQRAWTDCDPIGLRVVRDVADLRAIERFPGCGPSAFAALGRDLYVHVVLRGDCHAAHEVHAYRSAARREYRIVVTTWDGGCRAARSRSHWMTLPPLPEGWTVAFTDLGVQRRREAWRTDSLGAAADAVPLPVQQARMDCRPEGFAIVRDSADAHHLQRFPGCAPPEFPELGWHLYVRVPEGGFCGGAYRVHAYRSDARREYRVVRTSLSRGCGGPRQEPEWYRLPPLPYGWTVAFTDTAA
jgi:hypothetical protein